jgi:hypothetical protein
MDRVVAAARRTSLSSSSPVPRAALACIACVAIGLAGSCGDGGGAGSADAFVGSYCDLFTPCCAKASLRSDGQSCRALLGALAPVGSYDKQKGEACLAEMKAAAARSDFCDSSSSSTPAVCDQVFNNSGGTKQPGETCDEDSDCAASAEGKVECMSNFSAGAQVRKCQVQLHGKLGDTPCGGTVKGKSTYYEGSAGADVPSKVVLCYDVDGLRCDGSPKACIAYKAVGEACLSNGTFGDCVATAYCDSAQHKCAARKPTGAACGGASASSQYECVMGNYCTTAGMCAAQLALDAACTTDNQCLTDNCVNGSCKANGGDFGLALLCGTK